MRVGIDARMFGLKHAGIGRYVENLVRELSKSKSLKLVLFVRNKEQLTIQQYNNYSNITIIQADIPHYSLAEQLLMPGVIQKAKLNLIHFPHFNVPIFYQGKYVVTVHDLIKHISRGMETTTRQPWLYWLKYLGYKIVFRQAVNRAARILVPSQTIKEELVRTYGLPEEKIAVTYEGVGETFKRSSIINHRSVAKAMERRRQSSIILTKYKISKPFVIYTGSVYPHKNVERLIQSIKLLNQSSIIAPSPKLWSVGDNHQSSVTLVIACARSVFYQRFKKKIQQIKAEKYVNLVGFIPDEDLVNLYQEAEAFVFPTLSEGFGLPGLEAMACGLPVVCSDIPVLREIYGEAAFYFDPLDIKDMADKIKRVICDTMIREALVKKGLERVKRYSWQKMAKETLAVYRELI